MAFSDKSRFTLDGPDGLPARWTDVQHPGRWYTTRRNQGGCVMVWACFSYRNKSELTFIDGNIDSNRYCTVIETTYLPFIDRKHPRGAILQQDNAPSHTSAQTEQWFSDMELRVMDWTSRSPDVNPIENLWGILAQHVYNNGRQYDYLDDLKDSNLIAWNAIKPEVLEKLVECMTNRLVSLVELRRAQISN